MWLSALLTVVYLGWSGAGPGADEAPEPAPIPASVSAEIGARDEGRHPGSVHPASTGIHRFGPERTGASPHVGPASGDVLWRFEADGAVFGQPAVADEGRIVFGDLAGVLYCLDAQGSLLWRRELEGPIYGTPVIDGEGSIFVGSDADLFWSFDPSGGVRFRIATEGDADTSAAMAPDGSLRFAAGEELWSISRDGEVLWRTRVGEKVFSSPAISEAGETYVGSEDDHLHAIGSDGNPLWTYEASADVDSGPVIGAAGRLYFGANDGLLYQYDLGSAALRQQVDLGGALRAPLALRGDMLVVAVSGERPRVVALDASTLESRWSFEVGAGTGAELGFRSGPIIDAEGNIYVGAPDGFIYSIGASGTLRWTTRTLAGVDGSPVITPEGTLLVGGRDHYLYAIGPQREG